MSNTPTPRTDAQLLCMGDWGYSEVVDAAFARELERELAAAREQWRMSSVCRELRAELYRERALADRLARPILAIESWIGPNGEFAEALAAWKEARREA